MSDPSRPPTLEDCLAHAPFVENLARSITNDEASAQDLVQETWLAAVRQPPRRADTVRAWLATVLRNAARNRGLAETRRTDRDRIPRRSTIEPSVLEGLARRSVRDDLGRALERLSARQRRMIVLRYYDDLPPRRIADETGIPIETVRSHLKRGLGRLREILHEPETRPHSPFAALFGWTRLSRHRSAGPVPIAAWSLALLLLGGLGWLFAGSTDVPGADGSSIDAEEIATLETVERLPEESAAPLSSTDEVPTRTAPPSEAALREDPSEPVRLEDFSDAELLAGRDLDRRYVFVRTTDGRGRPFDGELVIAGANNQFSVDADSTGPGGWALLEFDDSEVGAFGFVGWEERVGIGAMGSGRVRSPIQVVDTAPGHLARIDLSVGPMATRIRGRVVDRFGDPVPNARVTLGDRTTSARPVRHGAIEISMPDGASTNAQGYFEFAARPPGRQRAWLTIDETHNDWFWIDVPAQADYELQLCTKPRATVTGTVRGGDGQPIAGARVVASWDSGTYASLTSTEVVYADAGGRYELDDVPPGPVLLWAQDVQRPERVAFARQEVDRTWSAWNPILEPTEPVTMRVTHEGSPVHGAHLVLTTAEAPRWRQSLHTDADGRAQTYVAPQGVPLEVVARERSLSCRAPIVLTDVRPSPTVVEVSIPSAVKRLHSITGIVRQHDGSTLLDRTRVEFRRQDSKGELLPVVHGVFTGMLPIGSYRLSIVNDHRGCFDVDRAEPVDGRTDLGVLSTPELASVHVLPDSTATSFELTQVATNGKRPVQLRILRGPSASKLEAAVFPGEYELAVLDKAELVLRTERFSVASGAQHVVGPEQGDTE